MSAVVDHDSFQTLVRTLHEIPEPDRAEEWPAAQMELLAEAGGNRWNISRQFGGDGVDPEEMLEIYRELARGSLLTTLILTQRNAACQRIESSPNQTLAARLLPALCRGELFATVGISHLTTSRQHMAEPAVIVTEGSDDAVGRPASVVPAEEHGFRLTGSVPWATAASQADIIVTGGTLSDGRQILAAVPRRRDGVTIHPSMALMGLSASQTSLVELQDVWISMDEVLHGPIERVMSAAAGAGAGSLGTSAVAIGTAQGTLRMFAEEVDRRPELAEFFTPLEAEAADLCDRLREAAGGTQLTGLSSADSIRRRANSLVVRAAQAWLAATKGAGYTVGHPAERAVRESMFFLVWSCPQLVLEGNLRELACSTSEADLT
jgi:alkylation response protein AidB-like acyl-CoA dehydrogenase